MDSYEKIERKRNARRRRRAQQLRAGALRSRVVAISLICFALLWGIVFVQMATGNDPVLGPASQHGARPASRPPSSGSSGSVPPESPTPEVAAEPEPVEPEVEVEEPPIEEEFEEPEAAEPEPEPEPAPIVTSSS
jgi:outer membrane biosynthesis protein TonB